MARVGNNHNCIDTHSEEINQSVIHQEKNLSTSQQSVLEQHEASHDKVSKLRNELMKEIEKFKLEVETLVSKNFISDLSITTESKSSSPVISHITIPRKECQPREKVFQHRESLLTELFKISHIRTFRHIFISLLIIICFQILVFDYTFNGKLNLDFDLFRWCFNGFGTAMLLGWLPMKLSGLFFIYYAFKAWAMLRKSSAFNLSLLNNIFLAIYLIYAVLLLILPLYVVNQVAVASRIFILMEQVRILMKCHAFVRSNIPRVLEQTTQFSKNDSSKPKSECVPQFSKYLFFMFAPTLVYRDNYPRSTSTNWRLVIIYFIEIIGSIIYTYCLFDRFCVPVFRNLKVKDLTFKSYIHLISISILPGALMQFMVFFSFLHCWHNAFAEMLRFGDRQFYLDWWNSTSFNMYYRTWNTLVHDWLYTYLYHDLYKLFGKKYRAFCQFSVIFISSIFHEHILSFAFGYFYPVLFVQFAVFGFIIMFIPRGDSAAWNVFIWTGLFTGLGIQICLFSIEWYARLDKECPRTIDSIVDYFIPRSILCLRY